MPGSGELLLLFLGLAYFTFIAFQIAKLVKNKSVSIEYKLLWLSVIIFFPVLGYFIYSIAEGYQIGKG